MNRMTIMAAACLLAAAWGRRAQAVLLASLLAAGCSGTGQAPPTPSPSAGGRIAAVYLELARCIRSHGVPNFPDPIVNPQTGKVDLPPGTTKPPQSAMNACKSIVDRLPAGEKSRGPVTAAEMAKLRDGARCMRQHGLSDWPDPNADGGVPAAQAAVRSRKEGHDVAGPGL